MFFLRPIVLLAIALYSHALIASHIARPHHHHRAIAPRIAASLADPLPLQPRRLSKRCKPRPSSPAQASDPHTSYHPSSTSEPKTTQAPPATTTSSAPPPPPSTTEEAPTSSATHSSSTGGNRNLPSFLVGVQTGQSTYYDTGLGACGITNTNSDYIAAVSHLLFDAFPGYNGVDPNTNPVCGRKVKIMYQGKTVTVTITDRCVGCKITDLDLAPIAFSQLANEAVGRFDMRWYWL